MRNLRWSNTRLLSLEDEIGHLDTISKFNSIEKDSAYDLCNSINSSLIMCSQRIRKDTRINNPDTLQSLHATLRINHWPHRTCPTAMIQTSRRIKQPLLHSFIRQVISHRLIDSVFPSTEFLSYRPLHHWDRQSSTGVQELRIQFVGEQIRI